jgi:4-alpha-glucanotransferase
MNMPGEAEGNWAWRFQPGVLTEEIGERLKFLTETYGR